MVLTIVIYAVLLITSAVAYKVGATFGFGVATFIGLALIWIIIALSGIVIVPTVRRGVVVRFKKRTGRVLDEGPAYVIPLADEIQLYPYELRTDEVDFNVFSLDRLEITIRGSIQWRPDSANMIQFVEIPENTILKGLNDAVESELGKVSGEKEGDVFIRNRKPLEMLINCIFLLERAPHFHLNPIRPPTPGAPSPGLEFGKSLTEWITSNIPKKEEELNNKLAPEKWEIPIVEEENELKGQLDTIRFFEKNSSRIQIMLTFGKGRSAVEKLYAIEVSVFRLAHIDFSSSTKKALERQRQAKAEAEAAEELQKKKLEIMEDLIAKGVSPGEASAAADVLLGVAAPRQVISLEGASGAIPLLNIPIDKRGGGK
jgi:regulator of protease activity HflC (stomatin/prohibitin superfamily)